MATVTDTDDRVRGVIYDHLGKSCTASADLFPRDFPWDADLRDDLGADDLDMVEIAIALEEEFDIEITDDAVYDWRVADDLRKTVAGLV